MTWQVVFCDPVKPFWTQTTTLDGVSYLLTFSYNTRETCYYLNIDSSDGTVPYASGIKLVVGIPLLRPFSTPPGELMVVSAVADDSPPRLGDLADGGRCTLLYVPEAELFAPGNQADLERFPGFMV